MRFWSRASSEPVPSKKQTRNEVRNKSEPIFGQRRPFSDPRDEASYQVPPPESPTGQWQSAVDPTDTSPGGRQFPEPADAVRRRPFTIDNLTTDRAYDAATATLAEMRNVVGTFIRDTERRLKAIERQIQEIRGA